MAMILELLISIEGLFVLCPYVRKIIKPPINHPQLNVIKGFLNLIDVIFSHKNKYLHFYGA